MLSRPYGTEAEMTAKMRRRVAGLTTVALMLSAALARAAGPDTRVADAAAQQDWRAVETLVKAGVEVNAAQADGATALLWTAHWNESSTADLLIGAHANVNAANDHGVTPLALACENGSVPTAAKPLRTGAAR